MFFHSVLFLCLSKNLQNLVNLKLYFSAEKTNRMAENLVRDKRNLSHKIVREIERLRMDWNHRPPDYESGALPAALRRRSGEPGCRTQLIRFRDD